LGQTIFGDGAAAVDFTVGRDLIVYYALSKPLADLDGKKDLILMAMGDNKFVEPCVVRPVASSPKLKDFPKGYFSQNGPRVFEDVQNAIPGVIRGAVAKAGFKPTEIDLVVVHSGSKRLVDALRERLSPDFEVYSDYADANMSSVSLLYSFIKAIQEGRIGRGSKVVLCGFGAGSPDLYSSTVVVELR
jgi:3-oxoacyl-[acyl-carrier-protein] synthase-3